MFTSANQDHSASQRVALGFSEVSAKSDTPSPSPDMTLPAGGCSCRAQACGGVGWCCKKTDGPAAVLPGMLCAFRCMVE